MNEDVYKNAIMRALPAAPEIPLDAPPAETFDFAAPTEPCPNCGGLDAVVQEVEDAEVAKCPCGCEFPPRLESVSRQVIRGVAERRERRFRRFMERLPLQAPVPNLDQTDYDLFRKLMDNTQRKDKVFEPDAQRMAHIMSLLRERFIDERTNGFVHPQTGEQVPPIPRHEAEARWPRVEQEYRASLEKPDDTTIRRLRHGKYSDEWAYGEEQPEQTL